MTEENQHTVSTNDKEGVKNAALFAQLSVFSTFIIPFGSIIGPIVVKAIYETKYPELKEFFNESINFQLSVIIYSLICIPLCFVLIGFPLIIAISIMWLVCTLIGLSKVCNYDYSYKYPLTMRMIK